MHTLHDIKAPINNELEYFQKYFKRAVKSNVALLNLITNYLLKSKGKQMRPMLVFFSAQLAGEITEKSHRAAAMIELLHTATLVHDDVVDDSNKRRGLFSVNALWKNKAAVLVGDYLLSKGLLIALENKDYDILEIVSRAVKQMSEGELLQMEKSRGISLDEDIYFDIVTKKTASFFAACCATGACSANASEEDIKNLYNFGLNAGIAFQIKDDLFDYQKQNLSGKPVNNDLKDKKITLPLIYLLNNATFFEKRKFINIIKNHRNNNELVSELISKVYEVGGISYAEKRMKEFANKALDSLSNFNDCQAKESLKNLIIFTTDRTN